MSQTKTRKVSESKICRDVIDRHEVLQAQVLNLVLEHVGDSLEKESLQKLLEHIGDFVRKCGLCAPSGGA